MEAYQPKFEAKLDFNKNIMITNGANSSINVMCQTILREGDEMIVIEPFFPQYLSHI